MVSGVTVRGGWELTLLGVNRDVCQLQHRVIGSV